jgi:predicted Zn-dependent protease
MLFATENGAFAKVDKLPPFLPEYFSEVFEYITEDLVFLQSSNENNVEQFSYASSNNSIAVTIERIQCDRPSCRAMLNNLLGYLNKEIKEKSGKFQALTPKNIQASIHEKNVDKSISALLMPSSIHIWNLLTLPGDKRKIADIFRIIERQSNRQRYEEAVIQGNVAMGFWGPEIYAYAKYLNQSGQEKKGVAILRKILETSPLNYQAHIDFMDRTPDANAAKISAEIVFKNSENKIKIKRAADYLGISEKDYNAIPFLEKNETGLQMILIPLQPCNIWLLEETAATYEKITGVPVKIRRLAENWNLKAPDRIFGQRHVQSILIKLEKKQIDFSDWRKPRYISALKQAVSDEDPYSKYYVMDLIKKINLKPGLYEISPYLDWFSEVLRKIRSNDFRTMYVGITEVNIFDGDNNYIFSMYTPGNDSSASILSYNMMLAETLSEEFESRKRLTDRIAKELVPASLKSLGIPRSTDPTCPYSYSSGVDRLDQKTLNLSDPVRRELEKFRTLRP